MALARFAAARNSSSEISESDLVRCNRADRIGACAFAGTMLVRSYRPAVTGQRLCYRTSCACGSQHKLLI